METTVLLSKILGPVLLLRGVSILVDRQRFVGTLEGLEQEATSVAFSVFPFILFMASVALAVTHSDTSNPAAILLHVIAWGGIVKGAVLILWPGTVLAKAEFFGRTVIVYAIGGVCTGIGTYFTWYGYFRAF